MTTDPPTMLDPAKSLIITSREGFRAVADPASGLTLGKLLAARHEFMNAKRDAAGRAPVGQRDGTLMAFTKLAEDVDQHNDLVDEGRGIGLVTGTTNPFRDRILAHWPELPADQQDGPFRLLAVINRVDVAGANDNPGGGATLPEDKRKFFGEGRLVFGLTVPADSGEVYPMTLIMEYHLPFVTKVVASDGTVSFTGLQTDFNQDDVADDVWIEQRKLWAGMWFELSKYELSSPEYQQKLLQIVRLFARPENSVALRVGQIVEPTSPENDGTQEPEFEYRESYSQGGFLLAPRDLARDVHPCVAQQPFFAELIEQRWSEETRDMEYDYKWPSAIQDQAAIQAACSPLPMGAEQGAQGPRVHVSRFLVNKWWPPLYGTDPDDNTINNMEEKRHDFAMTTCSGCHSAETGTPGFMIFPREEGQDSALAPFLRGPVTVTLPNGATYSYDELARRKALLLAFLEGGYPGACAGGVCAAPPPAATNMQEEMLRK